MLYIKTYTSVCAHLERNLLKIYRNKRNRQQKLQRKMKHILHVQQTFSVSLLVFDIIK
jgi:hypothetical protein